jgi:hypothetical protein
MNKKNLLPEQKLMKAVHGNTIEEINQRDERCASSVSNAEFQRTWGISLDHCVSRMSRRWDALLAAARP